VTSGLFIRTYPARGAQIIPVSYSAGVNGYFLVCLIPVFAVSFFTVFLFIGFRQRWVFEGLIPSVSGLLLALSLLRRLKLGINVDGISYTGLFRAGRFVAFSEISTVVLIDHKHMSSQAKPRSTPLSWTAIITPNVETGKSVLKIPLSLFPGAAYREIERILKPEVWESGT
jgi:hypothetical protein